MDAAGAFSRIRPSDLIPTLPFMSFPPAWNEETGCGWSRLNAASSDPGFFRSDSSWACFNAPASSEPQLHCHGSHGCQTSHPREGIGFSPIQSWRRDMNENGHHGTLRSPPQRLQGGSGEMSLDS